MQIITPDPDARCSSCERWVGHPPGEHCSNKGLHIAPPTEHKVDVNRCGCEGFTGEESNCGHYAWRCSCGVSSLITDKLTDFFDAIDDSERHKESDKTLEQLVGEYIPARMVADAMVRVGSFDADHQARIDKKAEDTFGALIRRWHKIKYEETP